MFLCAEASWAADSQFGQTEDNLDGMASVESEELDGIEAGIEEQEMEEQEMEEQEMEEQEAEKSPDRITPSEQISRAVSFSVDI